MKFSKVPFVAPKGLELIWRGVSDTRYQLLAAEGWELTANELGVLASHSTREQALFLPWGLVGPCDVLPDSEYPSAPNEVRRGPGRPPKVAS